MIAVYVKHRGIAVMAGLITGKVVSRVSPPAQTPTRFAVPAVARMGVPHGKSAQVNAIVSIRVGLFIRVMQGSIAVIMAMSCAAP